MVRLPGNCRYGKISVSPSDWKTCGVKALKKKWYISFRFYDDNANRSMLVIRKGFNDIEDLGDRRYAVTKRIAELEEDMKVNGYNPISGTTKRPILTPSKDELTPHSLFIDALKLVMKERKVSPGTMEKEIGPVMKDIETATKALGLDDQSIWDTSLKHLYKICTKAAEKRNGIFSGDKFNRQKKVLRDLYKILLLNEVVPANLPMSLPREKEAPKKKKEAFTVQERQKLDAYLKQHSRRFWLFIRIFFHSGARSTELLRVKRQDIDLEKGIVTYLVLKGNEHSYKERPILDIALPFWKEAIKGAKPKDYIFGEGLLPGSTETTKNAIKLRWQRLAKELKITKGMYSLKHTHSTAMRKRIGVTGTALLNAESEYMINKHYDLDAQADEFESIRKVKVDFLK